VAHNLVDAKSGARPMAGDPPEDAMSQQSPSNLAGVDAVGHAELVRKGEATPRELVDAAIARIEKQNTELNAVIHATFEKARAQASAPSLPHGPLRGVPFLMKDLGGQTAGDPYHAGMRFLRDAAWREAEDSYFAAKLRAAGAVFLGRTNTPELGLLPTTEPAAYGATKNPWDLSRSAGGSSGGAAAAVASGMVPAAHASDGGGSIRIPAAHCGLVGLKTTRGRSSFGPSLGERWGGFSVELAVSRTVRDTAAVLDVVQGPMPGDPYAAAPPARPYASEVGAPPGRLRIGLMTRGPRAIAVHADCTAAVQRAARLLEGLGHTIEESYPLALDESGAVNAYVSVVATSVARALDAWGARVGRSVQQESVEPLTWALAEMARSWSSTRYLEAVESVHAFGRRVAAWWSLGFDLLLTPTTAEPPPLLGEMTSPPDVPLKGFLRAAPFGAFTSSFNMSGQPAVSLPLHWTQGGLPVGVQLVAATGREDLLLRVASQLEQAAPWAQKRPPVSA
jgi:amidase